MFPIHSFSTLWKYQKTVRFSGVFREYRKSALGTNGLTNQNFSIFYITSTTKNCVTKGKASNKLIFKLFLREGKKFYILHITQNHFLKLATFWEISLTPKNILLSPTFIPVTQPNNGNDCIKRNHFFPNSL